MVPHLHRAVRARLVCLSLSLSLSLWPLAHAADAQRQADVASRGADVMPFDLKATTHIFTPTADGGTQRVVAKDPADAQQVQLVRSHLQALRTEFLRGDYTAPTRIHGAEMPGLAELRAAPAGRIDIGYRDIAAGAELAYRTRDATLVAALHAWFGAQLSDHGDDAHAGHTHPHDMMSKD